MNSVTDTKKQKEKVAYSCNVLGCGGGRCVHRLAADVCPYCGFQMVEVITTGVKFCSNHSSICDYEVDAG